MVASRNSLPSSEWLYTMPLGRKNETWSRVATCHPLLTLGAQFLLKPT